MSTKSFSPNEPVIDEMIGKLIRAGFLASDQREDPAAIADAIDRMKRALRGTEIAPSLSS
jgi:hypothetical protein